MTEEAKEARREYMREWRKNNPTKQREYQATYWERKAKEMEKENENGD